MTTETNQATTVMVQADALLAALDQCASVMATGRDARPVLVGVHIAVTRDAVTLCGTDGFALVEVRIPSHDDSRPEWSAILAGGSFGSIKSMVALIKTEIKAGKGYAEPRRIALTFAANMLAVTAHAETARQTAEIPIEQGSYPNYGALIPDGGKLGGEKQAFDGRLLGPILAIAGKYTPSGIVRVRLGADVKSPARLDWVGPDELWTARAVIMPMYVTW